MEKHCIMAPAYGRSYRTAEEALADFHANKDFMVTTGRQSAYSTKREMIQYGFNVFEIYLSWRSDAPYTVFRSE